MLDYAARAGYTVYMIKDANNNAQQFQVGQKLRLERQRLYASNTTAAHKVTTKTIARVKLKTEGRVVLFFKEIEGPFNVTKNNRIWGGMTGTTLYSIV